MVPPAIATAEKPFFPNLQQHGTFGYPHSNGLMNMHNFHFMQHPNLTQWNANPIMPQATKVKENEVGPLSEKESKDLRRKRANRESARRSKLRKKEEFERLTSQADALHKKGMDLRTEIARMGGVLEILTTQNQSLRKEVLQICGNLDCIESSKKEKGAKDDSDSANTNILEKIDV